MKDALPLLFIVLSGLALCAVIFALWESLRRLSAVRSLGANAARALVFEREALLAEKHELLTAIRDVQFEHDLGKVSDQDFKRLNARYRGRAREVLRGLDEQLSPHRQRAQELLGKKFGAPVGDKASGDKASGDKASGDKAQANTAAQAPEKPAAHVAEAAAQERLVCPSCGADNDGDAIFCKKCAHRFTAEGAT